VAVTMWRLSATLDNTIDKAVLALVGCPFMLVLPAKRVHCRRLEGLPVRGVGSVTIALGVFGFVLALALPAWASGDLEWAVAMGGSSNNLGRGIAVDATGNVYTTGTFQGTANFRPFQLTSAGSSDIFVAKQAPDGTFLWARSMGGTNFAIGDAIAVDAAGNVYTTGWFAGTADFDPGLGTFELTAVGFGEIFVSKLDANGEFVWARSMETTDDSFGSHIDEGRGIAVDAAGNVYTTGNFSDTVDFDPGPGVFELTSLDSNDIFVSKLDTNGDFVWARAMGGTSFDSSSGIAVDAAGNVYTTGEFNGTADFNPGPGSFELTSAGSSDIFVSKLDADGEFVWARAMGGTGLNEGRGIAVDDAGNAYTTGWFSGTADFDPGQGTFNLTSGGFVDVFVSKLDTNGDFIWARAMGGTTINRALGIAVDAAGSVYTTGLLVGTADFDPGPGMFELTSAGATDIFVSKLDTNGDFVWARVMGGLGDNEGSAIAVDGAGNVYTTGSFSTTADFDPGVGTFNLTSAGTKDIFVVKLSDRPLVPPIPGDVNGDGVVNAVDVQLVINAALGIEIDPSYDADINGDGTVNAVDVQLVINAALGIAIDP